MARNPTPTPTFALDLTLPEKMKPLYSLFCLFVLGLGTLAAQPGRPGAGMPTFVGRVLDATTETPIPFASIGVRSLPDSTLITGSLAGEDGMFRIETIPPGEYLIQVSFMGYKTWAASKIYSPGPPVRLGDIALEPAILNLDEAVVVEQQSTLEMKIDRRVFNVGSDLTQTGSNAQELLTNVPSVTVDIDGNVFLRGSSNVQILIDGRPSGLAGVAGAAFLQQLPASSIDRVEIITNPSAKYDPDGMAGILNIILKKEKRTGLNGSLQTSLALNGNFDANLSLNRRSEKVNLYGSLGWNQRNAWSESNTSRLSSLFDDTSNLIQTRSGLDVGGGSTVRIGGDWFVREDITLSLSFNGNLNHDLDRDTLFNEELWTSGLEVSTLRFTEESEGGSGWDADLSYRQEFNGNRDHNLRIAWRQSDSRGFSEEDMAENTLHLDSALQVTDINKQEDRRRRSVFSIDFEKPLVNDGRLEWGWKSNVALTENAFEYIATDSLTYAEGLFIPWNPRTEQYEFSYREGVHAAYGTWGREWGVWGVSAGMRLEQVFTLAEVSTDPDNPFENNYFSMYPSLNISRQRNDENTWIASYSRRVNRPRGRQVDPFLNDADPRNIRTGNPSLLPEYTHSMEVGHQWSRGRKSVTTSLFFKHTTDVIRWYSSLDSLGIRTSTFINFESRHDEGLEVIAMSNIGKSGSFRITGNLYHLANNVGDADAASDASGWTGNLSGFASFTMGEFWKAQLNGMYRGASVTPQGRFNGFKSLDFALSRTFLDQNLTATCRVSDVFDMREWSYTTSGPTFTQDSRRKRQSRFVYLSVQWRFGKMDPRRDRSGGGDYERGGGMDGGGGMEF